ncbi:hypothetical protein F5887DRAFT_939503 [Amanita rubescens]|nr:hypothetical protein F5887DRAFT_939503 [Amanita rubescens]
MSAFYRLLPASKRCYSSYFSSKSGGGRFFNSSKSSRSSVITGPARQTTPIKPSDGPESRDGGINAKDQPHSGENTAPPMLPPPTRPSPLHPVVKPKDFKVVQFFSMHRPLLSLPDPPSIFSPSTTSDNTFFALQSSPSEDPLFTSDTSNLPAPPSNILSSVFNSSAINAFDDFSETFPEGDVETARQLTRALAMSKAGSMVEWEKTLRMLGLDPEMEPERVVMREQMEKDWEVMMDSTKRKRRKKMKKHKLKKRRRLTRSTRLKIGR